MYGATRLQLPFVGTPRRQMNGMYDADPYHLTPILQSWIYFNSSMDKWSHVQENEG